jgi:tetratricopeptide (TPR) repeat protein
MAKKVNKRFLTILTIVVVAGGVIAMAAKIILPKIFKKNPEVLVARSAELERQGKIDEAINAYQLACAADMSNLDRQVALGDLYLRHLTLDKQYLGKAYVAWTNVLGTEPHYKPALQRVLDLQWAFVESGGAPPKTYIDARDAAAKLVETDPTDRQAAARLNRVEIAKAVNRLPADEKLVREGVKKLREMALQDPADADLPFWAMQGQMWLAQQASRRGAAGQDDAQQALAPVEPAVEAMLKGQERNPRMQWRAAQLYTQLAFLEQTVGRAAEEDGTTQPSSVSGAATRPATRDSRAERFAAIARKAKAAQAADAAAATQPVREPAGRFTERVTAAYEAALANALPPVDGKPGTPDYGNILLDFANWKRQLGQVDKADEVLERVVKQLPDEPAVRLAYSDAYRDNPAKRDRVIEVLSAPLQIDGLPGVEAVKRKNYQVRLDYELLTMRLTALAGQTDPAKRKQGLDAIAADVKKFESETSEQSITSLEVHGRLALLQGNLADGIKVLQMALDRWPEDLDPRRRVPLVQVLAGAYSTAGQTGQAERLWGSLVERYPNIPALRVPWIYALRADGQVDEAKEALKELRRVAPRTPELPALAAMLEGGATREKFVGALPEDTPEQRVRKAVGLRMAGKVDEAQAMLEGVVSADPKQLAAVKELVRTYLAANRRDEATSVVDRAVKASPDNAELKALAERLKQRTPEEFEKWVLEQIQQVSDPFMKEVNLADFYGRKRAAALAKGDEAGAKQFGDETEKHLAAAERIKPNDPTVATLRFNSLVQQKRFGDADVALQRMAGIAELAPNIPMMRYELAAARNDVAAAEVAARDITRDRPQFAVGWNYLGNVRMSQRRFDEAKAAYTSALERKGNSREALIGLIRSSYATEDIAEAKSYIDKAREALPDDDTFREFALDHEFKYGNRDKVIAERERLYQTRPEDLGNTGALLDMYLSLVPAPAAAGTPAPPAAEDAKNKALLDKARKVSEDAVKRWPADPHFAVADARIKLASGDFLGGERVIKDFADNNRAWGKVDGPLELAAYYAMAGKPASADEAFAKAVAQSDNDPAVKLRYAQFLSAAGRRDEAARQLEGVPGADVARQRIEILSAAGHPEEADKALQAALAANPDSVELSNLQIQSWINTGRLGDAQQAVKQRLAKNGADDSARYLGALSKMRQSPPDFAGAVHDLTDVLTRNPKNANAQAMLAEARFGAGDVGGAIDDMDRALQNAPLRADLRRKLISWCAANGRPQMVARLAGEAVNNPSLSRDPTWLRALANAQSAMNDLASAERSIIQAEAMVPKAQLPDVQKEHLDILNRGRANAKMLKLTDGMLAAGQKDFWIYAARGLAKSGLRDRGAAQEFDTALAKLDPEKDAAAAQGIVTAMSGTLGTAEALKRVAKWEESSPQWRVFAANLCANAKDYTGAVKHLQPLEAGADKLQPEVRKDLYQALGMAKMQAGDPAGAADAFKKFLDEQPGNVLMLNNLASMLSDAIQPPRLQEASGYAKQAYEVAHAWAPGSARSAIYDTYGWILVQSGGKDLDEGIRVLGETLEEFPIIEAYHHLGEAYLLKKQPEQAQEQFARGLELINKMKRDKRPYDTTIEAKIKDAQARALKLATAAPPDGIR